MSSALRLVTDRSKLEEYRGYQKDLFGVGPEKPMGYLPIDTLQSGGKEPAEIEDWAAGRRLGCRVMGMEECRVYSGAVYVWDPEALQRLLDANRDILKEGRWPFLAEDFVVKVAIENVPQERHPELYELIGVAFADFEFDDPTFVARPVARSPGP